MWKLTGIYAQNICAFRELHYELQQGVTTLIFGDNRDNESQRSNGSGKSALIECIAIGITGSPLRKIKNEEIINDNSDECLIELQFKSDCNNETLTIERKMFRKAASEVICTILRDKESNEIAQPSVDACNKYILEKLGISRDELFNNFILSRYRYRDFLSSSDKDKKDIINRFSNGILVDRAIERIREDMQPVEETLKQTEIELAGVDGRIGMLTEQIEQEETGREEKLRTKEEKIAGIGQNISARRTLIREKKEEILIQKESEEKLKSADDRLQELENSDISLEESLLQITSLLTPFAAGKLTDWKNVIAAKKQQIDRAKTGLEQWDDTFLKSEKKVNGLLENQKKLKSEYQVFSSDYNTQNEKFTSGLNSLDNHLEKVSRETEELKTTRRNLSAAIDNLHNRLAGSIACPSCGYEFLVSDKEFDVPASREELHHKKEEFQTVSSLITDSNNKIISIEREETRIKSDKRALSLQNSSWTDKLNTAEREVKSAVFETEEIKRSQKRVSASIASLQEEAGGIRRKVFDEAFSLLDDAFAANERKNTSLLEDVKAAETSIETLENTIRELKESKGEDITATLKASLKEYRKKSAAVLEKKTRLEKELSTLEEQEQHFVMFKSYLANSKIEALGKITNEFLENIGSDIRIRFSGYTALKTGKIREKISVSLIRAGLDCGSFGKFSAGEAARVNLATILSMQKLINSNCDIDKGLDLLVLDEILEAVDEDGLSCMFEALNKIGVTALVVSHGNIAEGYKYKLKIIKENGESKIEE
ncbi:MAG: SMC family ATPase [Tannerella sp.]|jgi:exonuclease SbcC|nr:SMC family ATPase [Tannerella sp.]